MKKVIIENAIAFEKADHFDRLTKTVFARGDDNMTVSDGYHTFDELYDHRIELYIALCKKVQMAYTHYQIRYDNLPINDSPVWRSKVHSDGSVFEGWFVLGVHKVPGKQITYHLPLERWEETNFAETLEKGPEFDGHTPAQVLERLKNL